MTKHLRFLFVMLLAMIWSAGWAAVGDTYQKVTSESELSAGDIIVFASGSKNMAMADFNVSDYYNKVDVVVSEGMFDYVKGLSEFELGGQKDSWTFKNINDDSYLLGGTAKKMSNSKSVGANNKASLTFEKDYVKVKFGTYDLYLCLNVSAQRFACYATSSKQTYTQIYKLTKKDSRKDSEIAFSSKSYEAKITDKDDTYHSYVTLNNPNNLSVTYASSKTDVAEVNAAGEVKVLGLGTTTISATFAGDDTYQSATVSYELTVVDPNVKVVVFTAGKEIGSQEGSGNKDEMKSGDITIYGNNIALNPNKPEYRFYANSTFTVSVPTGTITKIVFTGTSTNNGMDRLSSDGYTYASDKKSGTWIGEAKTVTFENASNAQAKVKTITVYVSLPSEITLDENSESYTIEAKTGVNVTLNRSMVANEWNTICLPFDVTWDKIKTVFGEGVKVAQLDNTNSTGTTLKFVDMTDYGMLAAEPYLIKPVEASPADGYKFDGVEIKETAVNPAHVKTAGGLYFNGIYNMVDITTDVASDYYAAFLGAGNKIYKTNGSGNKTKGFRAYFAIPNGAAASALRVVIDGTATSIKNIDSEVVESNAPVYNLQGQRVNGNNLTPGIYVKAGKKFVVK